MTVRFLAGKLTDETQITLKDMKTGYEYWNGSAKDAWFEDKVVDWDFSNGHIIYI